VCKCGGFHEWTGGMAPAQTNTLTGDRLRF
jgi:hypothetical protein